MGIILNIRDKFVIGDLKFCDKSRRTIDIKFNRLATNKGLLDNLNLISTYSDRYVGIEFCASYLSSFTDDLNTDDLLRNPTLRILILDDDLLEEVKKVL